MGLFQFIKSESGDPIGKAHHSGRTLDLRFVHDLHELRDIWTEFQRTAWHTPFQEFDWIMSWYQSKPRQSQISPTVVLGYEGDELMFILPLSIERHRGAYRLTWLAGEVNDYNCPLIALEFLDVMTRQMASEVWAEIAHHDTPIDIFHLTKQPEYLANIPNPFISHTNTGSSCDSHILALDRDWRSLHQQLRSNKSRARLRQKERKLSRAGKVCFRSIKNPTEQKTVIEAILRWKSDQLEKKGDRNPFKSSTLKQTIEIYSEVKNDDRPLRVYGLYLDGTLIAGIIAFVSKQTFFLFTTSYDPAAQPNSSPGTILLVRTLELAARAGFRNYDFLAGDETYKINWCNQRLRLVDSIYGVTTNGFAHAVVNKLRLGLKKTIKSSPSTVALFRTLNLLRNQSANYFARWRYSESPTAIPDNNSSTSMKRVERSTQCKL